MKDLHCHIMYGIDDGAKTIEDSMTMLERQANEGVTDIILTPHYILNSNTMQNSIAVKEEKLREVDEMYNYLDNYFPSLDINKTREI